VPFTLVAKPPGILTGTERDCTHDVSGIRVYLATGLCWAGPAWARWGSCLQRYGLAQHEIEMGHVVLVCARHDPDAFLRAVAVSLPGVLCGAGRRPDQF
jgi:hypothetical protein